MTGKRLYEIRALAKNWDAVFFHRERTQKIVNDLLACIEELQNDAQTMSEEWLMDDRHDCFIECRWCNAVSSEPNADVVTHKPGCLGVKYGAIK